MKESSALSAGVRDGFQSDRCQCVIDPGKALEERNSYV